jgi:Abnormal spindle-like microcephaly-assoc'd, ASPM-SPD-2-Hydin
MSCRCRLWFRFLDLSVTRSWLLSLLLVILVSRCGASVAITTTTLPNGTVNTAYSAVINASRGCTPYKWAVASGALPAGVTSNVSSATTSLNLTGTPTTAATYSFAVKVTGCGGHVSQVSYKVIIQTAAVGYLTAPSGLNLGSVTVGSSQTQPLTVSNSGASSLIIFGATVSGTGFSVSGLSFPYTLSAGGSASLSVTFAPSTTGTDNATLSLTSNASNASVGVALTGSGTTSSGNLGVTPGSLSFGSVAIGTTQTQSGSVTASGGSVTLSSASSSNSAFMLGGLILPVTLAAGQSMPFTITFAPTTSGTASANIFFFTSTSTSALETASGSGANLQHTVDLSWNASTSTSITGYNVYRGALSGGPYSKINLALATSMSYSDSTVQSGQTYYYATTAVDTAGVESSYSNEVQVVVPSP